MQRALSLLRGAMRIAADYGDIVKVELIVAVVPDHGENGGDPASASHLGAGRDVQYHRSLANRGGDQLVRSSWFFDVMQ